MSNDKKLKNISDFLQDGKDYIMHMDDTDFLDDKDVSFVNKELSEIKNTINKKIKQDYLSYDEKDTKKGLSLDEIESSNNKIEELSKFKKYDKSSNNQLNNVEINNNVIKHKKNKNKPKPLFIKDSINLGSEKTNMINDNYDELNELINIEAQTTHAHIKIKSSAINTKIKEDKQKNNKENMLNESNNFIFNIPSSKLKIELEEKNKSVGLSGNMTINQGICSILNSNNLLGNKRELDVDNLKIEVNNKLKEGRGKLLIPSSEVVSNDHIGYNEEPLAGKGIFQALEIFKSRGYFDNKNYYLLNRQDNPYDLIKDGEINIEHRDEKGRLLNHKEAHKEQSKYFHGKGKSLNRREQRLLKDQIFEASTGKDVNNSAFSLTLLRKYQLNNKVPGMSISNKN